MLEHHTQPLLSVSQFLLRLLHSFGILSGILVLSLLAGTLGYRQTEGLAWIEAFYNASLIMSGMGPVDSLQTDAGKIFASIYALYSGLFLIGATGILLMPLFHRMLHSMHLKKVPDAHRD